jgi:hypothetical protein
MSVLETPRILFSGNISWDPITTNNTNTFYDEVADVVVWPPSPSSDPDPVDIFRQDAIAAVMPTSDYPPGNWNPDGTHKSTLFDTTITGVDLGDGPSADDKFCKSAVNMTAMLVDLEPFGTYSSQLFFDNLHFGVAGGYEIACKRSTRVIARYLNFSRNTGKTMIAGVASVMWQTSFLTEDISITALDSVGLQTLAAALKEPGVIGLTVRFNTYATIYFDDPSLTTASTGAKQAAQDLIDKLNAGGFQPNPARSRLVGVIGLWRAGEPANEPGDRALISVPPTAESTLPAFGTAFARLNAQATPPNLTLDMSNSVAETNLSGTKAIMGNLVVSAGNVTLATLTPAQYDQAVYQAGSGIISVPLTDAQVAAAQASPLLINADGTNVGQSSGLVASEQPWRAIPLVPNLYFDQPPIGQGNALVQAPATFQVYYMGAPATAVTPVTVCKLSADGVNVLNTTAFQTDSTGRLTINVTISEAGIWAYVPCAGPDPDLPGKDDFTPQTYTYLYVRVLTADEHIAALPPTWANVYTFVLSNWNAMAPCMDNWLRLNDPDQVKAYGPLIKKLTDPNNFEIFRYMPVTRDLTQGSRSLLYAFLDQSEHVTLGTPAPRKSANWGALSRSLRGG